MEKITQGILENGVHFVEVTDIPYLDIFKTFDCGQCFRFDRVDMFGNKYEFGGVAFGRYVVFAQNRYDHIIIYNSTKEDYEKIWRNFLSLDTDYASIDSHISKTVNSEHMDRAIEKSKGIRILRQDGWECICSFIISQNNNIPRIKGIISRMCEKYGESIRFLGNSYYAFPSAKALLEAGEEEIFNLKTGFRAKYIYDACQAVCTERISVEKLKEMELNLCIEELCKIKGIGLKVSSCALLFGFNKTDAFPVDVWMKRALEKYFPQGFDYIALGKSAGIAQQYLFYYEKYIQNA